MSRRLRIWRSFSANNSGSFIVVARFSDAGRALAVKRELTEFVAANSRELEAMNGNEAYDNEGLTMAALAFGEAHGISWGGRPIRATELDELAEVEIEVVADHIGLWHIYCHGFEDFVHDYLRARGGVIERSEYGYAELSLLANVLAVADPQSLLAQLGEQFLGGGNERLIGLSQWPLEEESEHVAGFYDGQLIGMCSAFRLSGIERVRSILAAHGVNDYRMKFEANDIARFNTIHGASCAGCKDRQLIFLEAIERGTPNDQLACENCGAMYDLDSFRTKPAD